MIRKRPSSPARVTCGSKPSSRYPYSATRAPATTGTTGLAATKHSAATHQAAAAEAHACGNCQSGWSRSDWIAAFLGAVLLAVGGFIGAVIF